MSDLDQEEPGFICQNTHQTLRTSRYSYSLYYPKTHTKMLFYRHNMMLYDSELSMTQNRRPASGEIKPLIVSNAEHHNPLISKWSLEKPLKAFSEMHGL